jgi:tripartite-type tricarboxylate transporter receptor subunit TctC
MIRRKLVALSVMFLAALGWSAEALSQAYPQRPVRIVVPFAPGGRVEGIARILAQSFQEQLGQPFVVESRGGAGGSIGSDLVAKAPGDGYTLLLASAGTHAILPTVDRRLPYDSIRDFTAIAMLVEGFTFIAVHPSVPANNIAELVALARREPQRVSFATSGVGTFGHFAGELFNLAAGIRMRHIPYRGSGPAMNDLSAGHVPMMIAGETVELAQAGRVRMLGTTNEIRWPELPDVPTMAEQGFPQFTVHSWIGLMGPANVPREIVTRLNQAAERALQGPGAADRLRALGTVARIATPEAFADRVRADRQAFAEVARNANLTFE